MHGTYDLPPGDLSGFDSGGRFGLYCAAVANALRDLISDFAATLTSLVQSEALARARDQVTRALDIRLPSCLGRISFPQRQCPRRNQGIDGRRCLQGYNPRIGPSVKLNPADPCPNNTA
jgi:hypothetical protein